MMSAGPTSGPEGDVGALLRARGLRVTPQRRAILAAFRGAPTEHLSADEVHARASVTVPDISRGTVYAALAELTELGLLAAVGNPEPVRFETNATDHEHFRCRLCLRLYDIELPAVRTTRIAALGFTVERTNTIVDGVCADCVEYDSGLRAGAQDALAGTGSHTPLPPAVAGSVLETPIGDVLLAATSAGLVRAVFEDHVDAAALRKLAGQRRGGHAARGHLADASAFIAAYFGEETAPLACAVDWDGLDNVSVPTLRAVQAIGPGLDRSYETLRTDADAHERGLALGTNPLVLVVPCHRVTRGREVPEAYVGGPERKRWLRQHEQRRPDA
jgi:Fe2+ or Zn2+ uptake regulation protein/O6-methylguanine-DNA--protein-cysteine methyltransferase